MGYIERNPELLTGLRNKTEKEMYRAEASHFQNNHPPVSKEFMDVTKNKAVIAGLAMSLTLSGCGGSQPESPTPSVFSSTSIPTEMPIFTPSPESSSQPTVTANNTLKFLGVDTMSLSKDTLRDPLTPEQKAIVAQRAKELGVTHVAIATPYDLPSTPDPQTGLDLNAVSITQTQQWLDAIRNQGLSVMHRSNPAPFEGMYDTQKNPTLDYIQIMKQYMIDHADFIQPGDIWIPITEPDNDTVVDENCTPDKNTCMFNNAAQFNTFIQEIVQVSRETLTQLGKQDVTVLCCGFNGYSVWRDNNNDQHGTSLLYPQTIQELGSIVIDHYPQKNAQGHQATYQEDLEELHNTWPGVPIYITEFSSGNPSGVESVSQTIQTFVQDPLIRGFSWFQMGPTNNPESLLNQDLTETQRFHELEQEYVLIDKKRGGQ